MKCDDATKSIPLFLYGELSFEEEEQLELHLDECSLCRSQLTREKAFHRTLDAVELVPSSESLAASRQQLRRTIAQAGPVHATLWSHLREMLTLRFHPTPAVLQPLGALGLIALGFFGARTIPLNFGSGARANVAGFVDPVTSRVRYVEPVASGKIQIVVDETRQRVLSGNLDDQSIRKLLLAAAKDPSDPGLRVESVDLLKGQPESTEIRRALLYALQHDANSGVRLKALDGLKGFAEDPETRKALTQVLLTDQNPGVRTQVIDLLIQHKNDNMVGVLQELMRKEDNGYIRMRCQRALNDMNASVETF
jgi:HEAT repeat protein/putative zinc finger protein